MMDRSLAIADQLKGATMNSAQLKSSAFAVRRRRRSLAVLFGLATLFATLLPVVAQAACRGGFCVSGTDQNGVHTVTFSVSITNYTHFNANTPQGQIQLGPNVRQFSFRNGPSGQLESFALQACYKNFLSSRCTPWATLTHTPQ
jgi:hypothetical protein